MRDADLDPAGDSKPGLRIAMLVRAMPLHHLGGMELYAETMRQGLTRLGHTVTTITTPWPSGDEQYIEDQWGAMYGVGSGPSGAYSKSWDESSVRMLLALHERNRFDVIASHGKAAYPYLRARSALASRQRLPVVIISHGTIAGELRSRLAQLPHQPLALLRWLPRGVMFWRDDRLWLRHTQHITALSQRDAELLRHSFPLSGVPISVIPNGVDVQALSTSGEQRAAIRQRFEIGDDTCVIAVV
ncbi:MAG TPA: glycosyltransferase, partial [Ktedonobacterales bacterium]|nr:glycosyltransferase [Ktedonobacterales bacterium]